MKKLLLNVVRMAAFGLILYVSLDSISFEQLRDAISRTSIGFIIIAFIFFVTRYFLQSLRWHLASKAYDQNVKISTGFQAQVQIAFLEMIFPLPDSEDGLRLAYMKQLSIPLTSATAIVLFDRMIGISILLLLLPTSLMAFANHVFVYSLSQWAYFFFFLISVLLVMYHRAILRKLLFFLQKYLPVKKNWWYLLNTELRKKIDFRLVLASLLTTFTYALFGAGTAWLIVKALNQNSSFFLIFAGVPLYYFSAILPISYQGLALYETTLVFVLQLQGLASETAIAAGLLHFTFHLVVIALGGISYLLNQDKIGFEKTLLHFTKSIFKKDPLI